MHSGGKGFLLGILDECRAVATAEGYPPRAPALERATGMLTTEGSPLTASMFRDIKAAIPPNAIIVSEGANTMDIGRTQMPNFFPRHRLDAGTFLGQQFLLILAGRQLLLERLDARFVAFLHLPDLVADFRVAGQIFRLDPALADPPRGFHFRLVVFRFLPAIHQPGGFPSDLPPQFRAIHQASAVSPIDRRGQQLI